jgi:hypothetical protein
MESFLIDCHIQIYYVSGLERAAIRYPMAYNLIDARAQGFGELVIVIRRRICLMFDNEVMHLGIYLISGDPRLDQRVSEIESFS